MLNGSTPVSPQMAPRLASEEGPPVDTNTGDKHGRARLPEPFPSWVTLRLHVLATKSYKGDDNPNDNEHFMSISFLGEFVLDEHQMQEKFHGVSYRA